MLVTLLAAGTAPAATVIPVMTGLDNPRGLDFGPDGALYVAEAGRGGPGPPNRVMRGMPQGWGATGAISRLRNGVQEKWITGLPSFASANGFEAEGVQDVAFACDRIPFFGRGDAYVTMGFGQDAATRATYGAAGALFGKLLRVSPSRAITEVADITAFDSATNPDGGPSDSNPFRVLPLTRWQLVADAGGNTVYRVAGGSVYPHAVFAPPRPNPTPIGPPMIESVPTSMAIGPDGALYVSELTGVPFLTGFARIFRVNLDGSTSVVATGLTAVVDLAFGPDGQLYALQHAACGPFFACPGNIVRVGATAPHAVIAGGFIRPGGMTIGPDGAFYVTQRSLDAGLGEVLRIVP
jgi:hypothetical protein